MDNAAAGTGKAVEPTIKNNILQMTQEDLELGHMAITVAQYGGMYGVQNLAELGLEQKLYTMAGRIYNAVWWGVRQPQTTTVAGYMQGIDRFINVSANLNRVNAASTPLTETMINDALSNALIAGMPLGQPLLLVGSPKNIRVIANLKTAKTVYNDPTFNQAGNIYGSGSPQFYIPLISGLSPLQLITDVNMSDKVVYILTRDYIRLVPGIAPSGAIDSYILRSQSIPQLSPAPLAWLVNSTTPGQHGVRWTLRSFLSVKVKGALNAHNTIYNITP